MLLELENGDCMYTTCTYVLVYVYNLYPHSSHDCGVCASGGQASVVYVWQVAVTCTTPICVTGKWKGLPWIKVEWDSGLTCVSSVVSHCPLHHPSIRGAVSSMHHNYFRENKHVTDFGESSLWLLGSWQD